eukprot:8862596-Lingulodinium_polyedra.AAC.1
MLAYLTTIFFGRHPPQEVGPRTAKEMRTLALVIDCLVKGELAQAADPAAFQGIGVGSGREELDS